MQGKLFLCATPIGNLDDMTFRVLETLKSVDLIAAEDTRNSIKLLNHFDIHTEMTSYHEYNKFDKAKWLIEKMLSGTNVALITDAGTPAISDPGEVLVAECHKAGITVTSLPGPAACITALTLSGLSTRRFCFEGFLPSSDDKKSRKRILEDLQDESRTMIVYEAPHHLKAALNDLYETLGNRRISICRDVSRGRHFITKLLMWKPRKWLWFLLQVAVGAVILVPREISFSPKRLNTMAPLTTLWPSGIVLFIIVAALRAA